MFEIALERFTADCRDRVFGSGHAVGERFFAVDVTGILELSGVHAEITIGHLQQLFEFAEAERIVHGQSAEDSQPRALMDETVELGRAGAVLTFVLYRAGQIDVIAGTWMLLYGTGIVTAGTVSVRVIPVMGLCFMGLGVASLFIPAAWADAMMAATFGGVHIVFGLIIVRKYGG